MFTNLDAVDHPLQRLDFSTVLYYKEQYTRQRPDNTTLQQPLTTKDEGPKDEGPKDEEGRRM